mmetsp:Transcript_39043/g.123116  ORF Transcript_39043/g.123116 Transcript_39043/m.123116 type:complete len:200 (+) Transcript_39043:1687-2286(+)
MPSRLSSPSTGTVNKKKRKPKNPRVVSSSSRASTTSCKSSGTLSRIKSTAYSNRTEKEMISVTKAKPHRNLTSISLSSSSSLSPSSSSRSFFSFVVPPSAPSSVAPSEDSSCRVCGRAFFPEMPEGDEASDSLPAFGGGSYIFRPDSTVWKSFVVDRDTCLSCLGPTKSVIANIPNIMLEATMADRASLADLVEEPRRM